MPIRPTPHTKTPHHPQPHPAKLPESQDYNLWARPWESQDYNLWARQWRSLEARQSEPICHHIHPIPDVYSENLENNALASAFSHLPGDILSLAIRGLRVAGAMWLSRRFQSAQLSLRETTVQSKVPQLILSLLPCDSGPMQREQMASSKSTVWHTSLDPNAYA